MSIVYSHERAEATLNALDDAATDAQIIEALTNVMCIGRVPPIILRIRHNGKAGPCPVRVDKVHSDFTCSVAIRNPIEARSWINDALGRGYEIAVGAKHENAFESVASQRRAIARRKTMELWRAKRAAQGPAADADEIPF